MVNATGMVGGFRYGIGNKAKLLQHEGVIVKDGIIEDFERKVYGF